MAKKPTTGDATAAPSPKVRKSAAPRAKPSGAGQEKPAPEKLSPGKPTTVRRNSGSAEGGTTKKPAALKQTKTRLPKASTLEAPESAPAAPPAWLKSYPPNMPAEIGPLQFASLGDLLVSVCRQYAGRPAFTCMDRTMTFAELERTSAAFAAYLQSRGLAPGARVALMMPNVLQYPIALMAVLRAGYAVVNVNPLYTPRELEHQLKDSGAEAIVILENFASTLQQVVRNTSVREVIVAAMGDMMGMRGMLVNFVVRRVKKMVPAWSLPGHVRFSAALKQGAAKTFLPPRIAPDDLAFLQYTGGTTGVAKGAMLLHRNIMSNVAQNALWVDEAFTVKPKPAHQVYICALPLYHIFALTVNAVMGMQQGAENVMIPNPRDIPNLVKEMRKHPFHVFPGLNTLFNALLNNADFRQLDFRQLTLTLGGGMAVQEAVARRWQEVTGSHITEGYGLSETSPVVTGNVTSFPEFTGTIGLPLPSTEIAIRDDDNRDLPLGEVGEICIRGPQVMAGYWQRPDETDKVMTPDGFFRSGDIGFMSEKGFVKIVDRKKDMILVSGFNVYPNELEDVVAKMPGVLEVAAVGVADEHSGEVPKLFIVRSDPNLNEDAVRAYCRENLTGYKRPKFVEFRAELPKSPVGKILRRELRG
ncbi:MAG: long-chain-fatty-acid--CoA ligase [Rhizobiaceae bacterium]|nr:long-chain-fatty-acid--CoA ligase [Rhizobiaceae bacterium]